MYFHEEIAMQMAKARIEEAVRAAEQWRVVRRAGAGTSARVRLGRSLVRLGHWLSSEPSPALS